MNAEQEQFRASLHDLLTASDVPAIARAWAAGSYEPGLSLWRKLADIGVTALTIPPEYDGLGATATDLVIAFEELGHHAVPGPAIESVAVIPTLLSHPSTTSADTASTHPAAIPAGSNPGQPGNTALQPGRAAAWPGSPATQPGNPAAQPRSEQPRTGLAADWLPRLAAGETLATLSFPPHMPYAVDANVAPLPFGGTAGGPIVSVDPARSLCSVSDAYYPTATTPINADARARQEAGFDIGALACAAQLLGCGNAILEQSVLYVQQRVQFGQAIGRFQAVKHHLADVRIALDFARPLVYHASTTLAPQDISAAKVAAGEAANLAARHGLQVHGAIGYTLECDLSLWLVKVRALIPAWGTASWHRNRLMELL